MCLYLSLNERAVSFAWLAPILLHELLYLIGMASLKQNMVVAQWIGQEVADRLV